MYRQELSNGQVRYREVTTPNTPGVWVNQKKVAEALRKAILDYIPINKTSLEVLTGLSCHNVPQPKLATFLKDKKLIGLEDQVYIAGMQGVAQWEGQPKQRGFQIGIGPFDNRKGPWSRSDSWFIWNAFGYDPTAEHSGYIRLRKNDSTSFFR